MLEKKGTLFGCYCYSICFSNGCSVENFNERFKKAVGGSIL
ncbi:MAG: hypothetical protein AABX85_00880 [Nanoarchaeota archaeon]